MLNIKRTLVLLIFTATANNLYAADAPATKTYMLSHLQRVTTNSANCKSLYHDLQQLTKKSIILEFNKTSDPTSFVANDLTGKSTNHTYTILKQEINGSIVDRIGTGSFAINNKPVEYVIKISADVSNKKYQFIYPIILSGDNGNCHFTAQIQPNAETIAAFKKNIQAGLAENKTDLLAN